MKNILLRGVPFFFWAGGIPGKLIYWKKYL